MTSTDASATDAAPDTNNVPLSLDEVNEFTDISKLSNAQLHELNQNLLNETADVHRPLIDQTAPIEILRAEYESGSQNFVKQIDWLKSQGYTSIRRTRGDGECFYRSVAFTYVERLLHVSEPELAVAAGVSTLESALPLLEQAGFMSIVYEDPYEVLVSLIRNIVQPDENGNRLRSETCLDAFQNPEVSNYIVMFLRLLTSAHIRSDPDEYAPFLFHPEIGEPMTVVDFCQAFVEATGKEADHVQMTALSKVLKININVAYLDGRSSDGKVDFVEFRNAVDDAEVPLVLLYRPGHYDILNKQ